MGRYFAVLIVTLLVAFPAMAAPGLEGQWRLVEQHYGKGTANIANAETPLRIEFFKEGTSLRGRMWAGGSESAARPWPSFVAAESPLPVVTDRLTLDAVRGKVLAKYRVEQTGDDLTLHITEDYSLEESGDALVGRVTVELFRDGKPSGSYMLRRRFEREP